MKQFWSNGRLSIWQRWDFFLKKEAFLSSRVKQDRGLVISKFSHVSGTWFLECYVFFAVNFHAFNFEPEEGWGHELCPQTSSGSKLKAWKLTAKRGKISVRIALVQTLFGKWQNIFLVIVMNECSHCLVDFIRLLQINYFNCCWRMTWPCLQLDK